MNVGLWGETEACRYLQRCGYEIVERNFRCRIGELDIVARKGCVLYFVEVKARRSLCYGVPAEAITLKKKQHIMRAAQYYIVSNFIIDMEYQIDVIELLMIGEKSYIRHTENVFM